MGPNLREKIITITSSVTHEEISQETSNVSQIIPVETSEITAQLTTTAIKMISTASQATTTEPQKTTLTTSDLATINSFTQNFLCGQAFAV